MKSQDKPRFLQPSFRYNSYYITSDIEEAKAIAKTITDTVGWRYITKAQLISANDPKFSRRILRESYEGLPDNDFDSLIIFTHDFIVKKAKYLESLLSQETFKEYDILDIQKAILHTISRGYDYYEKVSADISILVKLVKYKAYTEGLLECFKITK